MSWGASPPSLLQRWNPWCENVGYLTLTHHLLAYNAREKETVTFDVADLADSVIAAVGVARKGEGPREAEPRPSPPGVRRENSQKGLLVIGRQ